MSEETTATDVVHQFKQSDGNRRCGKNNLNNPRVTDDVERSIKTTQRLPTTWEDQLKQSEQNTKATIRTYLLHQVEYIILHRRHIIPRVNKMNKNTT